MQKRERMMTTAFMTGASGGIGAAIAARLEAAGYEVLSPRHGELDLSDLGAIDRHFASETAPCAVFVHAAGVNEPKPYEAVAPAELVQSLTVHALSFVRICQHLAPRMKQQGGGHILALSSLYGSLSRERRLAYTVAKHALNGAVQTLALELGPANILVNSLSPGFVDTVLTRRNNPPSTLQSFASRTALRRMAHPEDVAEVAFFLCSPSNRYLTGQDVVVDGGYSAGGFQPG